MHWHFRLVSSPNKAYLAVLTTHLACSYSSFWLISSRFVEQRSVIQRLCENQCLNNGVMQVSAPVVGKAAAQPPCLCWPAEWLACIQRDQPFSRNHLQYRLPLSQRGRQRAWKETDNIVIEGKWGSAESCEGDAADKPVCSNTSKFIMFNNQLI